MSKEKAPSLKEILDIEYPDTESVSEIQEANNNLTGFFQTLIEICEENKIYIPDTKPIDQKIKYKN